VRSQNVVRARFNTAGPRDSPFTGPVPQVVLAIRSRQRIEGAKYLRFCHQMVSTNLVDAILRGQMSIPTHLESRLPRVGSGGQMPARYAAWHQL
jgi:hypothetical protein